MLLEQGMTVTETLTWVDFVALAVLVGFFIYGAVKGFVLQLLGIVVLVLALLLASVVSGPLGGWLAGRWESLSVTTGGYIAFGVVGFIALLIGMYIANLVKGALEKARVLAYDRFLGGLLGLAKGVLAVVVLMNIVGYVALPSEAEKPPEGTAKQILESYSMEASRWTTKRVLVFLPDHMESWLWERSVVKGERLPEEG